jgi:hypothetical protein
MYQNPFYTRYKEYLVMLNKVVPKLRVICIRVCASSDSDF